MVESAVRIYASTSSVEHAVAVVIQHRRQKGELAVGWRLREGSFGLTQVPEFDPCGSFDIRLFVSTWFEGRNVFGASSLGCIAVSAGLWP